MIKIPLPGSPVRGSHTGKPVMALFDLLCRRWAMGIIWNLGERPFNFRELQSKCETISPTILNTRLKELKMAGLVQNSSEGYELTPNGVELLQLLKPFKKYAHDWAEYIKKEQGNE